MIVAIHQPHLLPWLGYLDRMAKADLFILLDQVQFERQNYQNRVQVKTCQGAHWLTVPICRRAQKDPIIDKLVDNHLDGGSHWGAKAFTTLRCAYSRAPFFALYASALQELLERPWEKLVDLDLASIELLRKSLGIGTPMLRSSELRVCGRKTELLVGLCRAVGADAYLAGMGGSRGYLDVEAFDRADIQVRWQDFSHPSYAQYPRPETFIAGLSAIDMLFNCGPRSGELLRPEAVAHAD